MCCNFSSSLPLFVNAPAISLDCFILKAHTIYTVLSFVQVASPPGSYWLLLPCFSASPWYLTHSSGILLPGLLSYLSSALTACLCRGIAGCCAMNWLYSFSAVSAQRGWALPFAAAYFLLQWLCWDPPVVCPACVQGVRPPGPSVYPVALSVSGGCPACLFWAQCPALHCLLGQLFWNPLECRQCCEHRLGFRLSPSCDLQKQRTSAPSLWPPSVPHWQQLSPCRIGFSL